MKSNKNSKRYGIYISYFLNNYTLALLFLYGCTLYFMTDRFGHQVLESFSLSLTLVIINLLAVARVYYLNAQGQLMHIHFIRHQFIVMTLVFFISSLVITLIHHTNVDYKGWWVFYINFYYLIGVLYSSIFCFISYLFSQNSARYTYFFALISLVLLVLLTCITPLANDSGLSSTLVFLLVVHFILSASSTIKYLYSVWIRLKNSS